MMIQTLILTVGLYIADILDNENSLPSYRGSPYPTGGGGGGTD